MKMISLTLCIGVVAVAGVTKVIGLGNEKADWTTTIIKLLKQHQDDYNARDVKALACQYEADGHRLAEGKPILIGRKAIEDNYREQIAFYNSSEKKLEATDLRFVCDDGAVAEFSVDFADDMWKGVILFKKVKGVPKISTLIYNMDS